MSSAKITLPNCFPSNTWTSALLLNFYDCKIIRCLIWRSGYLYSAPKELQNFNKTHLLAADFVSAVHGDPDSDCSPLEQASACAAPPSGSFTSWTTSSGTRWRLSAPTRAMTRAVSANCCAITASSAWWRRTLNTVTWLWSCTRVENWTCSS